MASDARRTALHVLNTLEKGGHTLDGIMEDVLDKPNHLSKRDRSLFFALIYGVLRWRRRLDWIIDQYASTPLHKIDPKILNILRIGLFQIIYLNRVPVSAAVNSSVEMAKSVAPIWVVSFVNALLRKASKAYQHLIFPSTEKDPVSAIAINKSFPEWLVKRWLDRFGLKETEMLCDAVNIIPPITVRTNTLLTTREKLFHALSGMVEKISLTRYAPDGISFFAPKNPLPEIPEFQKGWFQVQDEAAQLVSLMLDPKPDERVLDACAGLGGKTGHIAQLMKNCGHIIAMDRQPAKLNRLDQEMRRIGVSTVETTCYDLSLPADEKRLGTYDRILLDAPCSGLGVLRRNPDTKWATFSESLKKHQQRQTAFLGNLTRLVRPSGMLVYSVCSHEPEETDDVAELFLQANPAFVVDRVPEYLSEKLDALIDKQGCLKTFPHVHNMDGFFAVRFRRVK